MAGASLDEDIFDKHQRSINFNDLPTGVFNTARLKGTLHCSGGKRGDQFIVYRSMSKKTLAGGNYCEVRATGNVGHQPVNNENMGVRFYNQRMAPIPCNTHQDGPHNMLFSITSTGPQTQTVQIDQQGSFTYSKLNPTGALPHGHIYMMAPHRYETQINAYSSSGKGQRLANWGAMGGGDNYLVMSSCTLTQTSQDVGFGDLSPQDLGVVEKPFNITLGNCGNIQSAQAYKSAMRLHFSSSNMLANGTLDIEKCTTCAQNLRIEVLDESGTPINLKNPYPLSRNAVLVPANMIEQRFKARVSASGTGATKAGTIRSQLTFILTSI